MVVDAMAAAALPAGVARPTSTATTAASQLEAPGGTWGFGEDGSPPGLRQFVRALDEKLINAVQETVMNVMRFFLSKVWAWVWVVLLGKGGYKGGGWPMLAVIGRTSAC